MKLVILLHFISWVNSFSDISRKSILPNMIGAVNRSQFTPKMKAFAFAFIFGVNWPVHPALIIYGKNALPANIRKWVHSWNEMLRNDKFHGIRHLSLSVHAGWERESLQGKSRKKLVIEKAICCCTTVWWIYAWHAVCSWHLCRELDLWGPSEEVYNNIHFAWLPTALVGRRQGPA